MKQRRNFVQSTVNLCKVLKTKDLAKLTRRNKPLRLFYQSQLGNVYMNRLQWMMQLKRDPEHRKIMKTRDTFVAEDEFDPDEALVAAAKKRKFLLERMLEDRQHFPNEDDDDDDDDDEDNACQPYGLRNELHYHYR